MSALLEFAAEIRAICEERDSLRKARAELAARVTELEAKLAAVTPAVDEVDGFRVGDLVRSSVLTSGAWGFIESTYPAIKAVYPDRFTSYGRGEVTRKPVEVGDTVRVIGGPDAQYVVETHEYDDDGQEWARLRVSALCTTIYLSSRLVAIPPTVKP